LARVADTPVDAVAETRDIVQGGDEVAVMTTTHQPSALMQIQEQEQILLQFRTHFVAVKAFENELVARTGMRVFNIANTVVWDAMFAKRDLFVIYFASWIRGMADNGGFLGQLRALTSPDAAAGDLVDLLLFGPMLHFATLIGANALETTSAYWWQRRDAFLAALKAEQDAQPDLPMNDDALIEATRRRMVETATAKGVSAPAARHRGRTKPRRVRAPDARGADLGARGWLRDARGLAACVRRRIS
jgi:hypothetical protein